MNNPIKTTFAWLQKNWRGAEFFDGKIEILYMLDGAAVHCTNQQWNKLKYPHAQ